MTAGLRSQTDRTGKDPGGPYANREARVSSRHRCTATSYPEAAMATGCNRRQFLTTTAALAGAGLLPRSVAAQAGPWAQRPPSHPKSVNFVVWQYGKIYEQIAKQFEDDWGVKVQQIIEPNVEPQVAKLTTMYAAGDTVDVSQSPMQYLAGYIDQGIAQPIDGLPGVEQYVRDFTPF